MCVCSVCIYERGTCIMHAVDRGGVYVYVCVCKYVPEVERGVYVCMLRVYI